MLPGGGTALIRSFDALEALKTPDDESVAVKVTRNDGRVDSWLVRLTPALEGGMAAPLPLALPGIKPVETKDGSMRLDGHIGVVSEMPGETVRMIAGSLTGKHIDGYATSTSAAEGAGVYEGYVLGIDSETTGSGAMQTTAHFFDIEVPTGATSLPVGDKLKGRWISVSLGEYTAAGSGVSGIRGQNDATEMFRVASITVSPAGTLRVVLAENPYIQVDNDGSWVELQRPHRRFAGPTRRSFRIVSSAVSITAAPAWAVASKTTSSLCSSGGSGGSAPESRMCGLEFSEVARHVECQDPTTQCTIHETLCYGRARAAPPAKTQTCPATPACGSAARLVRLRASEAGAMISQLKEVEVFRRGVAPSAATVADGLSNNALPLSAGVGDWDIVYRVNYCAQEKDRGSIVSPVRGYGKTGSWGSPDKLLDRSLSSTSSFTMTALDGQCEVTLDLGQNERALSRTV